MSQSVVGVRIDPSEQVPGRWEVQVLGNLGAEQRGSAGSLETALDLVRGMVKGCSPFGHMFQLEHESGAKMWDPVTGRPIMGWCADPSCHGNRWDGCAPSVDAILVEHALHVANVTVPFDVISGWTEHERIAVIEWAGNMHIKANGHAIMRKEAPSVLGPYLPVATAAEGG